MSQFLLLQDPGLYAAATEHFFAKQRGWTLEILKSMGLMDTAVTPGRCGDCLGCSFQWIMESLMRVQQGGDRTRAAFFSEPIHIREEAATRGETAQITEGGLLDALDAVYDDNRDLYLAVVPLVTARRTIAARFRRDGSRIFIATIDPHRPPLENSEIMVGAMQRRLVAAENPTFAYETEEIPCPPGLHGFAADLGLDAGIGGFCQTCAAIATICCLAVDGAEQKHVMEDFEHLFGGDAAGLMGLIKAVSACANKLFFEYPGRECGSECCRGRLL